jgi:hypothetical protein
MMNGLHDSMMSLQTGGFFLGNNSTWNFSIFYRKVLHVWVYAYPQMRLWEVVKSLTVGILLGLS